MNKKLITSIGYKILQKEQQKLIKEDRPKIIQDIADARAHGDLKENAEYHAAKERQGWIEGRIQNINFIIANTDIIDVSKIRSKQVSFGATVTYKDINTEEIITWQIVGEDESDVSQRKISVKSPIARALIGKEVGDDLTIKVPKGDLEIEITQIKYI